MDSHLFTPPDPTAMDFDPLLEVEPFDPFFASNMHTYNWDLCEDQGLDQFNEFGDQNGWENVRLPFGVSLKYGVAFHQTLLEPHERLDHKGTALYRRRFSSCNTSPTPQDSSQPNGLDSRVDAESPMGSDHEETALKQKKLRSRMPQEARQALREAFNMNQYPSRAEVEKVACDTRQTVPKVRNWFNNARARSKRLSRDDQGSTSAVSSSCSTSGSMSSLDSFASDTSGFSSFGRARRRGRRGQAWRTLATPSDIREHDEVGQPVRHESTDAPTRSPPWAMFVPIPSQSPTRFCCTFCGTQFPNKSACKRHEESVHDPPKAWVCCDDADNDDEDLTNCRFCGEFCPDSEHMATHRYEECLSKPEEERTFYRRDHFVQHLHQIHFKAVKHPDFELGCAGGDRRKHGCFELARRAVRLRPRFRSALPWVHHHDARTAGADSHENTDDETKLMERLIGLGDVL